MGREVRVQIPPVTLLAGRRASVLGGHVRFESSAGQRSAADMHATTARPSSERSTNAPRRRAALLSAPANAGADSPANSRSRPDAASSTETRSSSRSWAQTTSARAARDGAFKRCCRNSGRYDGAAGSDYFPRPTLNARTHARADADRLPHSHRGGNMRPRRRPTPHDRASGPFDSRPAVTRREKGDDRRGPKRSGYRSERPGCGFESRPDHPRDGPVAQR